MKELNQKESIEINGGSFAMDLGWFIGQLIHGNFATAHGIVDAMIDYRIMYATK